MSLVSDSQICGTSPSPCFHVSSLLSCFQQNSLRKRLRIRSTSRASLGHGHIPSTTAAHDHHRGVLRRKSVPHCALPTQHPPRPRDDIFARFSFFFSQETKNVRFPSVFSYENAIQNVWWWASGCAGGLLATHLSRGQHRTGAACQMTPTKSTTVVPMPGVFSTTPGRPLADKRRVLRPPVASSINNG